VVDVLSVKLAACARPAAISQKLTLAVLEQTELADAQTL
jgi:hypothetical protein